jgi:hypothetical protein
VQGAGRLEAVAGTELGVAQRQVAPGPLALVEDLDVAWASNSKLDPSLNVITRAV